MSTEVKYTSTKSAIWNKLKEVEAKLDESTSKVVTTATVAQDAKVSQATGVARGINVSGITQVVGDLVDSISGLKEDYDAVETAIAAKRSELKDIYGIEAGANTLVAIVATKDEMVAERQDKAETILTDARFESDKIITNAKIHADAVRDEINDEKATILQNRERDESEYKYNFARQRTRDLDAVKDEIAGMNKVLNVREEGIKLRELVADGRDAEIVALKETIEDIEGDLEIKLEVANQAGRKSAEKSANFAKMLAKKESDSEIAIRDAKLANFETKVSELTVQLADAQIQVVNATNKVSEMAQSAFGAQADAGTIAEIARMQAQGKNK